MLYNGNFCSSIKQLTNFSLPKKIYKLFRFTCVAFIIGQLYVRMNISYGICPLQTLQAYACE
jgi:hypothetical protein